MKKQSFDSFEQNSDYKAGVAKLCLPIVVIPVNCSRKRVTERRTSGNKVYLFSCDYYIYSISVY